MLSADFLPMLLPEQRQLTSTLLLTTCPFILVIIIEQGRFAHHISRTFFSSKAGLPPLVLIKYLSMIGSFM